MSILGSPKQRSKRTGGGGSGSGSGISAYNPATVYAINDIVNYNGVFYKCIQAATGKQPDTNADYWTIYDEQLTTRFVTDPAVNDAVSTATIDAYAGVDVILTAAPNSQTMQDPTNVTATKQFVVINDRTSTDNLVITIPYGSITIEAGHAQRFIWTGVEWVLGTSIDAEDVTAIPNQFNSATVQGQLDEASNIYLNSYEPTGVVDKNDILVTYDAGTRIMTVAPVAGSFSYYSRGKIVTVSAPESTLAHANTTGVYFLYYDESGTLNFTSTMWNFTVGHVPIAYVYYNSAKVQGVLFDERHGCIMDQATHGEFHYTVGTYVREWGFAIADYTLQPNPPANSDNQFSIAQGDIADEDVISTLTALSAAGPYAVWYRSGATGIWTFDDTRTFPFMNSTYIQYNEDTGATFQLTQLANNNYMNMYILASPTMNKSDVHRFPIVVGQGIHTTLADAQAENIEDQALGDLAEIFVEVTSLYKITFRTNASYSTTGKCRIASVQKVVSSKAQIIGATASNHSSLSGLTNDDHPQYPLAIAMATGIIGDTQPTFTDNGDGTFDVGSCTVALFGTDEGTDRINTYIIAADTGLTLTDNTKAYLVVDFNGGAPQYDMITNDELINETTVIPIYSIFRYGNELDYIDWDNIPSAPINKAHQRCVKTNRFAVEQANPPMLSESGTRNVNISACKVWHGFVRSSLSAFDSTVDDLHFWYHVAGVWTRSTVTQYENQQYDDGTDLASMTGNSLVINWVYGNESNAHADYVLSDQEYASVSEALEAKAPTTADLPPAIQSLGYLVGRIIVEKNKNIAAAIENAFESNFNFNSSASFMIKSNPTLSIVASAVDIDMQTKDHVHSTITLDEDITINSPIGIIEGSMLTVVVTQDAVGGWLINWGGYFTGDNGSIPIPTGTGLKSTLYKFQAVSITKLILTSITFNM